ncbi:MAG: MotA/TolQ/ExbB proton channel family protein [Campylobacterales bacterium]
MDLTKFLSSTLSYGVEPILYFLIFMSLISVAVIIERFVAFSEIEQKIKQFSSVELRLLLEKRLGILATFGNNAPFVGLFGTILGVMNAFAVLGASNTVSTSLVMNGISEALVATAMGLFVAIPSVAAYNYFIRRMRRILLLAEES